MCNSKHFRLNPIETIKEFYPSFEIPNWITYDKSINKDFQYKIIRQCSHDGTRIFHYELIKKVLHNVLERSSFYKPNESTVEPTYPIYQLGDIHVLIVYGRVDLSCGNYPGEKERIWIPVKCEEGII